MLLVGLLNLTGCAQKQAVPLSVELADEPSREIYIVATVIPVVESIGSQLVQNTPIYMSFLPPPKYSVKRVSGWLSRQPPESYSKADAVAGISAIWSGVDVYPALREKNIRVVPIDMAHALIPGGERVATVRITGTKGEQENPGYFWLNPSNALLMTGVMARDLSRLWPEHAEQLQKNSAEMSRALRMLQIEMDNRLLDLGVMQVVVDNASLTGLASASLLPIISLEEADKNKLSTLFITGKKRLKKKSLLPKNYKVWSVDDFSKVRSGRFIERWNDNLNSVPLS